MLETMKVFIAKRQETLVRTYQSEVLTVSLYVSMTVIKLQGFSRVLSSGYRNRAICIGIM